MEKTRCANCDKEISLRYFVSRHGQEEVFCGSECATEYFKKISRELKVEDILDEV